MLTVLRAITDALLPRRCHMCGVSLPPDEEGICPGCMSSLPRTLFHRSDMNPMSSRFAGIIPFVRATGFLFYTPESQVSELVKDFKYHKYPSLARRLGAEMGRELYSTGFFSDADVLMPMPVHWLKKARRGYNQTEMIARGVSEATGVPVDTALCAVRPHRSQTKLNREERADNSIGIFRLRHPENYDGRHIILMDDVCTTGATLRSAALAILAACKQAGASPRISLLTLCVTTQ